MVHLLLFSAVTTALAFALSSAGKATNRAALGGRCTAHGSRNWEQEAGERERRSEVADEGAAVVFSTVRTPLEGRRVP